MLIDTHIHLNFDVYDADRLEVIARAHQAGVEKLLCVGAGGDIESLRSAVALAEQSDSVWASAGIHPHDAHKGISLDELKGFARHPRVVAIGETGLDFFRDWSPVEDQYRVFREQIRIAREVKKPLIIHSRSAGRECLSVLQEEGANEVGGVFHCYGESASFAKEIWELGFYVSITGTLTFKSAQAFRETINEIPLTQLMLETDGPYMAPEPHRGGRSESAHVALIAKKLAALKGISFEEVCAVTTRNAECLFGFNRGR